jgi:transposase-like protein
MTRRRVLTKDQRAQIRREYLAFIRGRGYGALARKYGVGESTIRDVIKSFS